MTNCDLQPNQTLRVEPSAFSVERAHLAGLARFCTGVDFLYFYFFNKAANWDPLARTRQELLSQFLQHYYACFIFSTMRQMGCMNSHRRCRSSGVLLACGLPALHHWLQFPSLLQQRASFLFRLLKFRLKKNLFHL